MPVRLRYDLVGTGWAECQLEIDETRVTVSASYLSDALDGLCGAVIAILRGDNDSSASFDEEPGEYRWRFTRIQPDRVLIRILDFPELWGQQPDAEGALIFEAECRLRTFADALVSELQRLLVEHGLSGYRDKWVEHDFPAERVEELKRLLEQSRTSSS